MAGLRVCQRFSWSGGPGCPFFIDSGAKPPYTSPMNDSKASDNPAPTRMVRQPAVPFIAVKIGADKTYAVRRHSHDTLSVGIVEQGSSTILCEPLEFSLSPGTAVLIPPGTIHLCQPDDPERFRFKMIYIDPAWLDTALGISPATLVPATSRLDKKTLDNIRAFLEGFSTGDAFLDETHALEFVGDLLTRHFNITWVEKGPDLPDDRMDRVKAVLDQGFSDDIQLDDLTDLAGMSKYTLVRQFKARYQITPHAYVVNQRINLAKDLLRKGTSVAQTAVTCGFFDQSHFIKAFKHFTGIRPTDYSA